jgi:hypothetical protein
LIDRGKAELRALLNAGKLTYRAARTFPLEDIVSVLEAVETGTIGNVVAVNS